MIAGFRSPRGGKRRGRKAIFAALLIGIAAAVWLAQARWVTSFNGLLVYGLLLSFLSGLLASLSSTQKWVRFALFLVLFLLMVVVSFTWSSRLFDIAIYRVASPSMEPAIDEGSLIIVDKRRFGSANPLSRCDVIAFDHHGSVYVKRVVGLPLDRVEMRLGKLYVNKQVSSCTEVGNGIAPYRKSSAMTPGRHVFVLGDNHVRSEDSRTFGPVPMNLILGRVSDVL